MSRRITPEEQGVRLGAPEDTDPWVQCNTRMKLSMLRAVDARRAALGISRDEWMRRMTEYALLLPPNTPVRPRPARSPSARPNPD